MAGLNEPLPIYKKCEHNGLHNVRICRTSALPVLNTPGMDDDYRTFPFAWVWSSNDHVPT